jgi:hypothetical protein
MPSPRDVLLETFARLKKRTPIGLVLKPNDHSGDDGSGYRALRLSRQSAMEVGE